MTLSVAVNQRSGSGSQVSDGLCSTGTMQRHPLNTITLHDIRLHLVSDTYIDFYLNMGKLLCALTCFPVIRSFKICNNIVHKSFLILVRRLQSVTWELIDIQDADLGDKACR